MRQAILTVGPPAAGKTTFCEEAARLSPNLVVVSRDKICERLFGSVWIPLDNMGYIREVMDEVWRTVEEELQAPEAKLILDVWNDNPHDRAQIVRRLRRLGVGYVTAWYFTTPKAVSMDRCIKRDSWTEDGRRRFDNSESEQRVTYSLNYDLFHSTPPTLQDGFDEVVHIDATTAVVEEVLVRQASRR